MVELSTGSLNVADTPGELIDTPVAPPVGLYSQYVVEWCLQLWLLQKRQEMVPAALLAVAVRL